MKKFSLVITVCSALIILSCQSLFGANPPLTEKQWRDLKSACQECPRDGLMVCGNNNIGSGPKFIGNFFQGTPARGFFISPPYLSSAFKKRIRSEQDHQKLEALLSEQFRALKLIAVDKDFKNIRVITDPQVVVVIPKPLHDCLLDQNNLWGCGVTENPEKQCCEKSLGSPRVKVTWRDSDGQESVTLMFSPDIGATKLVRRTSNAIKVVYFCQTME